MLIFNGLASWSSSKFGPFLVNVTMPELDQDGIVSKLRVDRFGRQTGGKPGEISTWDIHEDLQKTFFFHVDAGS